MSKDAPKAPDYRGAAEEQAASSREVTDAQTFANRPNQYTPFGQTTWNATPTYDPATGNTYNRWDQYTTLAPDAQAALDAQLGLQRGRSELGASLMPRAQDEFGNAMNWSQFDSGGRPVNPEALTRGIQDTGRYYDQAGDAIYGKFQQRMDPRFQRDDERLKAELFSQGLRPGDKAYDEAFKDQNQQQDDAYEQAAYQATIGSGAEAQRYQGMDIARGGFRNAASGQAFDQNMAASGYRNTLRQQQIAEEMQRRGFSLNEINAILTGQQVGMPSMPSFQGAQRSEGAQYNQAAQNQGQYNIDAFNASQQGLQGLYSGLGSMGSAAMMFSDRRLKTDIRQVGIGFHGLPIYEFRYIDEEPHVRHYGVMADEAEKVYPEAVVTHESGYKMVNYARLS